MEMSRRDLLLYTLEDLAEEDFVRFKDALHNFQPGEGYGRIPWNRLENARPVDVTRQLTNFYGEEYRLQVAANVLDTINQRPLANRLYQAMGLNALVSEAGADTRGPLALYNRANVILDPETAHPCLSLSMDQKNARRESMWQNHPANPKRFDTDPCVLGCEGFTSGRHYWDVEVGGARSWVLGVARENVNRKGRVCLNPEEGIWALRQSWGGWYVAYTTSATYLPQQLCPQKVRVCLDYERGQVAFFSVDVTDSHIFTFSSASFAGEKILPFFSVGERGVYSFFSNVGPLPQIRLCP
uniref:B30.2/SPRY domain-containing protein n=1 Tax=Sphenodon punctatus TaxID=8508 RepID=A0A8D0GB08_SPHPU